MLRIARRKTDSLPKSEDAYDYSDMRASPAQLHQYDNSDMTLLHQFNVHAAHLCQSLGSTS